MVALLGAMQISVGRIKAKLWWLQRSQSRRGPWRSGCSPRKRRSKRKPLRWSRKPGRKRRRWRLRGRRRDKSLKLKRMSRRQSVCHLSIRRSSKNIDVSINFSKRCIGESRDSSLTLIPAKGIPLRSQPLQRIHLRCPQLLLQICFLHQIYSKKRENKISSHPCSLLCKI